MAMTSLQKAAALAAVQILFAGCSAGVSDGNGSATPPPPPPPAAPQIFVQPADQNVQTGSDARFTVAAAGTGLSYQWYSAKGTAAMTAITGATSSTYTVPAVTWQDDGVKYQVKVTNAAGTATSEAHALKLQASADQAAFESAVLGDRTYAIDYQLWWFASPQPTGAYLGSDYAALNASPLTAGPQSVTQSDIGSLMRTRTAPSGSAMVVLKSGAFLTRAASQYTGVVSYVGDKVRIDELADDGKTVAYSFLRSGYTVTDVSGQAIAAAPTALVHSAGLVFQNTGLFNAGATFAPGSKFMTFSSRMLGDRYQVNGCLLNAAAATSCGAGYTTLESMLTTGWASASDQTTYHLSDGAISTIEGVRMWVAHSPRPLGATGGVTEYRCYFELGGATYSARLIKDGTLTGLGSYRADTSNPAVSYTAYSTRVNKALNDSLAAASVY